MNSNTVLSKVMTLLSMKSEEEVRLAIAKLADGTILESPTFDVGESVEVIHEDGTKTPAPDGEHELELTGEEGEIVRFKIFTEGGIIRERENVELEDAIEDKEEELADVEVKEVKPLPEAGTTESDSEQVALEEHVDEEVVDKDAEEIDLGEMKTKLEEHIDKVEELKERIEELEKVLAEKHEEEEKMQEEEKKEEELESKRLDGAPVEPSKFSKPKKSNTFKIPNSHNSVLSRMYR